MAAPALAAPRTRPFGGVAATVPIVAALVVLAVGALRPLNAPAQVTVWCVSLALLTGGCLILVGSRWEKPLGVRAMRAGPWYLLWFGLAFALASLFWRTPDTTSPAMINQSDVVRALIVLHVVVLAWTAGYLIGPPRLLTTLGEHCAALLAPNPRYTLRSGAAPWILAGIGLAGILVQARSGHLGYVGDPSQLLTAPAASGQAVSLLAGCGNFAVIVAAIEFVHRPSTGNRVTLLVLIGAEILLGAVAGGKQSFIVALLAPAVVLGAAGHFPWRSAILGAVAFFVVVTPFVSSYRAEVRTASRTLTPAESVALAPRVFGDVLRADPAAQAQTSASFLGTRIREIDSLALVIRKTPSQFPYVSPRDLVEAPVFSVIPRFVWRSKPVLDDGAQFARTYYDSPTGVYSAAADPPAADLFRHGGLVVVVIGMFLLGLGFRVLDQTLHPSGDLRLTLIFAPLFLVFIKSEAGMVSLLSGLPSQLLAGALVSRLAYRSA